MINVDLQGRLGNQLFIYAMARNTQILLNQDKVYVNTFMTTNYKWKNSLINYNIDKSFIFYNSKLKKLFCKTPFIQNIIRIIYRKITWGKSSKYIFQFENKYKKFFEHFGMYICRDGYMDFNFNKKRKNIVLYGYFQCEKYFHNIRNVLLKELTPKYDVLEKNKKLIKEIENSNSVCVTIRIGKDFLNNPTYNVCTLDYFKKGMEYIASKVKDAKFYVFSDNPLYIRENFKFKYNVYYEEGNDPDYEKLRIMSKCKHFVISNSSFSWWAQYLSTNDNKIVVAPDRWYNNEMICDIYMKNFKIIST